MTTQQATLCERIQNQPYCDPTKRMDFVLFFDVRDGNPNGDPDAGNLPRMDPQTRHGIVTDVCIKRKVRDYFTAVLGRSIYIQSEDALNTLIFRTIRDLAKRNEIDIEPIEIAVGRGDVQNLLGDDFKLSDEDWEAFLDWLQGLEGEGLEYDSTAEKVTYLGEVKKSSDFRKLLAGDEEEPTHKLTKAFMGKLAQALYDAKKKAGGGKLSKDVRDRVKKEMCAKYDDIRLFGGVLTAGTNFGQVRGPMQLTFARSVEPILQWDAAITRCAITRESDRARKETEFGRKPWLNWAVYRQHGFFNPLLGRSREQGGTGITKQDLAGFWEALAWMFRNSDSASRGEMAMQDVIVFVHDHPRGNVPSHLLFKEVQCEARAADPTKEHAGENDDVIIERDGFDRYYAVKFGDIKFDGVTRYRPLKDLWPLKK
jgi:CRISPR-associated protein Csd2